MDYAVALRVAHKVKHSPKFNRKLKFMGITIAKGKAYITVKDKETGHVRHFGKGDEA
jgi:hypothetical protein